MGGKLIIPGTWVLNGIFDIALLADGKILAAAGQYNVSPSIGTFGLLRCLPDGTPDPDFGTNGIVSTGILGDDRSVALVVRPNGKVVLIGFSAPAGPAPGVNPTDVVLVQYDANGVVDPGFGVDGISRTRLGFRDQPVRAALQPDGKVVVAGSSTLVDGGAVHTVIWRFNVDGTPDDSFGTNGRVYTVFNDRFDGGDQFVNLGVQSDGKIVAVGAPIAVATATR